MKRKTLAGLVLALFFSEAAHAFDAFVVRDIRIEGIQRTEAGTVFSYMPVKVGDIMTDDKATAAVKALYGTGFFKDVRLEADKDVLVVIIEERPAVAQIDIVGNREFETDILKKGLREIGLAEGRIYDRALLDKSDQELKRQYLTHGKYGVVVTTTVTPLDRNRVSITFNIIEGDSAKIRQINIIGNKVFKEKELLEQFALHTPGWLSWYTKDDQYSKQKLSADLETLRSYYLNRGYLEFNVDSTQVSITPDKADIYISINITEGDKYTVSDVKLAGQMLLPEADLRKLVKLKAGDVFSREKLTESTKAIGDRLGNDGYAFANANASPELDKEKRQVAFTIYIDPGRKVYVRRINIAGNARSRDEVIRRQVRQMEGGWYDASKIQLSKVRLDRLQYFSEVAVDTPAVPGTSDQVDVNYTVTERPTGAVTVGAGFSSSEKLVLTGSISQQNIFGSGNNIVAQLNSGRINKVAALSFTDPYYTVDGVSRGFDLYKRNTDPALLGIGDYRTSTLGAGVRFGVPVTETDSVNYGLTVEHTKVSTAFDSPQRFLDFVNTFGANSTAYLATVGWARDSRDSAFYPTSGSTQRATLEVALPGTQIEYYKAEYQHQRYFPLSKDYTLMLNGDIGYGAGLGGKPLPFFKNYYAGGVNSVRGFETSTLGQRDTNGDILGGVVKVVGNAELYVPMPGLGLDKSVRLSAFFDIGNVYGIGDDFSFGSLKKSTGISVTWFSPVGPMKISLGYPLNAKPDDRVQHFQFLLGQVF
jgi:outer membrane protein insertion porin family